MATEVARLDVELGEVDLLVNQARTEAGRHEARRVAAAEKLQTAMTQAETSAVPMDPAVTADLNAQLVTLTKRAALMDSQVDVLEGKRRALARYRDGLSAYVEAMSSVGEGGGPLSTSSGAAVGGRSAGGADAGAANPAVSRLLLDAQEDLRREIARAMHDGPAQSLTNIVLQAQIVERLVDRDSAAAKVELGLLVGMVQQTLEATKSFIFDVRPMVLDDLGLVPTVRRAARDRGRRAQIPVEFESVGADRRLPIDVESGLFRMLDEALAGYLDARPDGITIRLDWGDERLEAIVRAIRAGGPAPVPAPAAPEPAPAKDLPPALVSMIEDRRAGAVAAAEAARVAGLVVLSPSAWRDIASRAATLGIEAEQTDEGAGLRLVAAVAPIPGPERSA
jgi:two-component system sensor histidine kinase DegS